MATRQPFEQLVVDHGATVLRVCRALLGPHDADDAWSETFVAALGAYPELPQDANIEGRLVTIAYHKAIDLVRATSRRPVPSGELPEPTADERGGEGVDAELWGCVASLPDKQRAVIVYRYVGGLSYSRIVPLVGGTIEAARRSASDGLANLRRCYDRSTRNRRER